MINVAFVLLVLSPDTHSLAKSLECLPKVEWMVFSILEKINLSCCFSFAFHLPDVPGCPSMYHHNEAYPNPPHSSDGNFTSNLYTSAFYL